MQAYDAKEIDEIIRNNMSRHDILDMMLNIISPMRDSDPRRGFEYLGFGSMRSYVTDRDKGLGMYPDSFVKIALAFQHPKRSQDKPAKLFDYLIKEEKWRELEQFLPVELVAKLGLKVAEHGSNQHSEGVDIINSKAKGGTSADYITRRLAKDGEKDQRIADIHKRLVDQLIKPHAAAIEAGYKPRTIQVAKSPEKVANKIKEEFTAEEIALIKSML